MVIKHITQFCPQKHDKDIVGRVSNGGCKKCAHIRTKISYLKNPDVVRNNSYKRLYGISLAEYNSLLAKQDFRCAICKRHVSEVKFKLAVDHRHSDGAIRGLLCIKCNAHLGVYEDKVFMQMCKEYLGEL